MAEFEASLEVLLDHSGGYAGGDDGGHHTEELGAEEPHEQEQNNHGNVDCDGGNGGQYADHADYHGNEGHCAYDAYGGCNGNGYNYDGSGHVSGGGHDYGGCEYGGYDDGGYHGKCFRIRKSSISPGVQTYLDGDEWQTYIKPEMELYRAVNSSLDLTIELLGRSVFDEHLRKFREAMQRISQVCEPSIRLPCTKDAIKRPDNETDCVRNDSGCGFDCLDRVAAELDLRGSTLRRRR